MDYLRLILKIQNNLEQYKKILEEFETKDINNFAVITFKGVEVCNSMLELILAQKGIKVNERGFVDEESDDIGNKEASYMTPLSYCCSKNGVVPDACRNFLNLIRRCRNQFAHMPGLGKEVIIEFSRALDYFTAWFIEQYINEEELGPEFQMIKSRFFSVEEFILKEKDITLTKSDDTDWEKQLLQKIDSQTEIIVNLIRQVEKLNERSERIENTVNKIDKKLEELAGQINAYQALVERQIEKADTDTEKDRIIQGYADECVERIVKATNANVEKRAFEVERRKLVASIGEQAWKKMDIASQTFLISAKIMYNHLILLDNQTDYSGVCVLVTKAIEVEMSKRFYTRFLRYLDNTYQKDYSKYHTALLARGNKPLKPEKFTMGRIAFAMCYLENKNDSAEQKQQNKDRLMEYSKKELFSGKEDAQISKMLRNYAAAIENIRRKYRNPSAHTDKIHKIDAEKCFDLVLDVEKILKKMLDAFSK